MHHLGSEKIIYAPGTNTEFLDALKAYGFRLIEGKTVLSDSYPGNIAYNAARVGNYAIHNFRYTDPLLKDMLEKTGVEFINVKQGYSKCSICIVDQNRIITSDKGIEKAAEKKGYRSPVNRFG
jgi:dihydroorotate dehydrogenase